MRHLWFAVYSPVCSTRVLLVQLGTPGVGFPVTKHDCSFSLTAAAVSALLLSLFDFFVCWFSLPCFSFAPFNTHHPCIGHTTEPTDFLVTL